MFHLVNYLSTIPARDTHPNGNLDTLQAIRSYMFKQYIKMAVEKTPTTGDSQPVGKCRVGFVANKSKSDFSNPMVAECNGAVMEWDFATKKFKPLALPSLMVVGQKLARTTISKYCEDDVYDMFPVYDGTIVNIYFYEGKWRISTASSYDVTDLVFVDGKTYKDVLEEIWEAMKLAATPEGSVWDGLLKHQCYSMCITYPPLHLAQSKYNCVVTNCVDMRDDPKVITYASFQEQIRESGLKLKMDEPVSLKTESEWQPARQKTKGGHAKRYAGGKAKKRTAYDWAMAKADSKGSMGVILRAKAESVNGKKVLPEYRTLFFPSELYKKIKKSLYVMDFTKKLSFTDTLSQDHNESTARAETFADQREFENGKVRSIYNMRDINALHKFLQVHSSQHYLQVVPRQKDLFARFSDFIQFIAGCIHDNIAELDELHKSSQGDSYAWDKSPILEGEQYQFPQAQKKLDRLIAKIWIYMKEKKIMPVNGLESKDNYAVIADMLRNVHWLDDYYSLLFITNGCADTQ